MASAITATLVVRCRRASEFQHFDGYIGWLHWRLHPSLHMFKTSVGYVAGQRGESEAYAGEVQVDGGTQIR